MHSRKVVYLAAALFGAAAVAFGLWMPRAHAPLVPCAFLHLTGIPCPFCGTTRAFLAAGHGAWADALHESPMGALLFPSAALLSLWGAWGVLRLKTGADRAEAAFVIPRWAWVGAALVVAANWIYRLAAGLR